MEVNLDKPESEQAVDRNMSTMMRKTASRHGEEYLEMNLGVGVEIFVILFCEKSAEKCQMLENGHGHSGTGLLSVLALIVLGIVGIVLRLRITTG